jgi:hypothetical protein
MRVCFAQRLDHPGDTRDQPAAAHRHHDAVHLGQPVENLQPDGPLPAHHEGIVVWRDIDFPGRSASRRAKVSVASQSDP